MDIRTDRLTIRDYRREDWKDLHKIFSDPEVMKDCEPPYCETATREALAYFMENHIGYAVVLTETEQVIGHLLFHQLPSEAEGIWEIGWFLNRDFWRQGYAYEAAHAMIRHGFGAWKLHKIMAETIDPVKSVALMEKLAMVREGIFRSHVKDPGGRWVDLYWYGICNPMEE